MEYDSFSRQRMAGTGGASRGDGHTWPQRRMIESLYKLVFAVAAIMAISLLIYSCSSMAPLGQGPAPLETLQQSAPVPPQADGN